MALRLFPNPNDDVSKRMVFHTSDIMEVRDELAEYEVVYLAALVGMDKQEKNRVIDHLAEYMAPGSLLMLRSAHGARAFLYPVVEAEDLKGFEVLTVFHPTDEVINSVVIARKYPLPMNSSSLIDQPQGLATNNRILPNKCSEIQVFNPLVTHGTMIEELTVDDQI